MKFLPELVPEARRWWRMNSMQALLVLGVLANWWLNSADLQAILPPRLVSVMSPFVIVVVALLRLRKQILQAKKEPPHG